MASLFRRRKGKTEPVPVGVGVSPGPEPGTDPVPPGREPEPEPEPESDEDRLLRELADREVAIHAKEEALQAREAAVKDLEGQTATNATKVREGLKAVEELQAAMKANARPAEPLVPPPPAPTIQPPPPAPPATRGAPDRWRGIAPEERVAIPDGSQFAADAEAMFAQGMRPSQVLEELGLPSNRFTHDQLRRFYLRQANRGPQNASDSLKAELDRIDTLRKLGLVYTRDDLDKAIDKALERAGGAGGSGDDELAGLDGESRSNVLMAREIRALGHEVIDAGRAITGHPKIGSSVAEELRHNRRSGQQIPTRPVPELPGVPTRSASPILPGGVPPQSPTPAPVASEQVSIEGEHPEFWPALDRIVELSPRIYEFVSQGKAGLTNAQVLENVQRDATLASIAAWRMSSKSKPAHEWRADGACVRCGTKKGPESIGKACPKGFSQREMLRRLYGIKVSDLIEMVGRYQGALEFVTPLDSLGGMSVKEFMMQKRWVPGDRLDLGGGTIYGTVLQTDEGLTWLGTFLGRLKEEVDKNPETTGSDQAERAKEEGRATQPGPPPGAVGPGVEGGGGPPGAVVVTRTVDMPPEGAES